MTQHLAPGRILYMSVDALVIPCRASSLLPSGFSGANFFLVQEIQPAKDIDLTCYKTLPTKAITRLQMGAMSLEWPVAQLAGSDQYSPSSSHEVPNGEHPGDALSASPHSAGGATHFNHLKYSKMLWVGPRVSIFLMAISDVLPGTLGSHLVGSFFTKKQRAQAQLFREAHREQQWYLSSGGTREE